MAELKSDKPIIKKIHLFHTNYLLYGILLVLTMMLGIFLGSSSPIIRDHMTTNAEKQEIFKYLEEIQTLEEKLYPVSQESAEWIGKYSSGQREVLRDLDQKITVIDEMMLSIINIPITPKVMESHVLLIEELKTMKYAFIEMKFAQSHGDKKSIERAKIYMKEFQDTVHVRKIALKKMMEQYKIPYIDLGDRIKYRTK